MGLKEMFLDKKVKIEAEAKDAVAKIESKKVADVLEVDSMVIALEVELKAAEDKGFDLGLAQAQVQPTDKIYTEADLQAEKELVAAPLKAEKAVLEAKLVELQASVDKMPELVKKAVADMKAALLAKYEEAQVAETNAETGFKDLLK